MTIPDDAEVTQLPDDAEQQNDIQDAHVLEDVKFRFDGILWCNSDMVQAVSEHIASSGRALDAKEQALLDDLAASGGEVPITISRYCILDINYEPGSEDNTQKAVGDGLARINETLDDGQEKRTDGQSERRWWYNSGNEGWELGQLFGDHISDLKPTRFEATYFQVYDYTDRHRRAGIAEEGDL